MASHQFRMEDVEAHAPEVAAVWTKWLQENWDPGHYDAFKDKDEAYLPRVDGLAQWVTTIHMPEEIAALIPPEAIARLATRRL